jgi:hypothetical protein
MANYFALPKGKVGAFDNYLEVESGEIAVFQPTLSSLF